MYNDSRQHLLDELRRIDLLVRIRVLQSRLADPSGPEEWRGLYISESEVDALLAGGPGGTLQGDTSHPELWRMREMALALAAQIAAKKAASLKNGVALRLERLAALFSLSPFEVDALLVCLAPEIDLRYERLYAYLQNDVTRKRPSVDLVLALLCSSFQDALTARRYFAPNSPLLYWHLVLLLEDPPGKKAPLLARHLKVDERIVDYLLDSDELDAQLMPFAQMARPRAASEPVLDLGIQDRLLRLAQNHGQEGLIFLFQGSHGTGKRTMAKALCQELGSRLLVVDLARLVEGDLPPEIALRLAFREALLQDAALYWENFDALLEKDKGYWLEMLLQESGRRPGLTFLAGERVWEPAGTPYQVPVIPVEFSVPSYKTRERLWALYLNRHAPGLPQPMGSETDCSALANKFRFPGGQIRDAVITARNLALARGQEHLTMDDLYAACRLHSNQGLQHLACKIHPHHTWDDIVLPPDQMAQLREIVNYVKHRPLVYRDWGFDRKLSLSKGLNALFTGPPGTGKTMAAEIIAGDLGLDLYKIDLSMVVSKYIGETEKNLNRIFREAETSNSILFFDEADALFGKRSEVRDSHDRYANIEIAYLLQKMEEYQGIVILATNLHQNLDQAFMRRMHFVVEFPFPEEEYRRRIWEITFPPEAPRAHDIDLDFLARKFKLAGGNIRNIILSAAFLAAEDGRMITMEHLIRATRREFQKMGKLVVEGDFGPYYELVRT